MMLFCHHPQRCWTRARYDLGAFLDPELDAPLDYEVTEIPWAWPFWK